MKAISMVIGLLLAVAFFASMYTISETEQVIITQFGDPRGDPITDAGLHFKIPFIQKVNVFDKRWLEWDGAADEMPTKEKTYIWVDTYARWRIADPLKFFKSVRDERGAQSRLDDIIDAETRNVIAAYDLKEVVRLTNRKLPRIAYETGDISIVPKEGDAPLPEKVVETIDQDIKMGRDKLTQMILEKAQKAMPDFGIELVDIQFQRVNYTKSVEEKVFLNMISERKRIAERYRSQGKGESASIRGDMEQELKEIESEAYKQVQSIKGAADAKAAAIYAEAYNRDPEFYRLVKSLESYQDAIDSDTTLIMSTDSDFFENLTEMVR